jgi:8-oxo-dGTP diphosphatase
MSRPNVGVAVFVFRSDTDNHILIGKRKGSHGSGVYQSTERIQRRYHADFLLGRIAHPGGHLEHGESFQICAQREVTEETGLRSKIFDF